MKNNIDDSVNLCSPSLSVSESGNEELCSELSPDVDCRPAMKRVSNGDSDPRAKLRPEPLTRGRLFVSRGFSPFVNTLFHCCI